MYTKRILATLLVLIVFCLNGSKGQANSLHDAVRAKDLDALKRLLDEGAPVDEKRIATPLYFAAQNGDIEAVELLVGHGADVNSLSKFGTPLHIAARRGHTEVATFLLENGADPNVEGGEDELTPLHFAAQGGSIEIAQLLLQHGANVNARSRWLEPAIHLAKKKGHEDVAALLIENGAAPLEVSPITPKLASADIEAGKLRAIECGTCHGLEAGKVGDGPNLWNIIGRPKASLPEYPYSPAMAVQEGTWGYEDLNQFLADATGTVPGTAMDHGFEPDETKRIALIAYLRTLSDAPVPLP